MKARSIHVIGAARGIGRWFSENVFSSSCSKLILYDLVQPQSSFIAKNSVFNLIAYNDKTIEGIIPIVDGDVIVLSVPVHELMRTVEALFPILPDGTLVVDLSSVKVKTHAVLEGTAASRLPILGMHPLFGPQVPSPVGQTVALTSYSADCPTMKSFRDMLANAGLLIAEVSPQEHDDAMLYIQVLTHFTYLTCASVLSESPQKLQGLLQLATPPFQMLAAFAGRILGSPLATYANIQRLAGAPAMRKRFIEAASKLDQALADSIPVEASVQALAKIVGPISGAEVAQCKALSATAIDSLQVFEQRLFSLHSTSNLCGIYRIDTAEVIPCRVGLIKSDRIMVDEQFVVVTTGETKKYAIAINDIAKRNYHNRGINISRSRRCELLKRNIRILSDADFDRWINLNILPITNDINIRTNLGISEEFCESWLPRLVPGVIALNFVEAYRKRGQPGKITLRVVHRPELELTDLRSKLQSLLEQVSAIRS